MTSPRHARRAKPGAAAAPAPAARAIPVPVLRRMPGYLQALRQFRTEGLEWVSCTRLAGRLGLDPALARKDFTTLDITGRPKTGFPVTGLIRAIESCLGWDNVRDAFLVGAGSLGRALLGYRGFREHGLNIIAAFDTDPAKIGAVLHGTHVLPLSKLAGLAKRMRVAIGIIATPAGAAQEVADQLAAGGIRAIWNFAPTPLSIPPEVLVENEDLSRTLAVLSQRLQARRARETEATGQGGQEPNSTTAPQNDDC